MAAILVTLIVILMASLLIGFYVAVTLGITTVSLAWFFSERPIWEIFGHIPWNATTSITLVALPLFILMGEILLRSGLSDQMYQALSRWLAPLPGGLLHTNIAACGVFAAISGSSAATAATIGGVSLPFMRSHGYRESLALGSLAAGGTLGILIPPSIVLIVYGVLVEESIGRLYIAGIIPGLLMMLSFMAVIFIYAKIRPEIAPRGDPTTFREKLDGLVHLVPVLLLIFLVLGTIYLGIATATEAAAFGATGAFLIALVNGRVNREMVRATFQSTATTTSMIMFILIGAFLLQFVLAFLGLPTAIARWVIGMGLSKLEVVLIICVIYLVLGMFMESMSMVVITVPVLLPLLKEMDIDLIWFGIIVTILVETALITPPVGMNLFILQGVRGNAIGGQTGTIKDVYWGALPFFLAMLATLTLIIAIPQLAIWLAETSKSL